jgi:hypothetical protein
LSETNLDWKKHYMKNDYLAQQWKTWTYAKTSFSLIDMESSSDYMTGQQNAYISSGKLELKSAGLGGGPIWEGLMEQPNINWKERNQGGCDYGAQMCPKLRQWKCLDTGNNLHEGPAV